MDVRTELSPEGHFSFEVLAEGGVDIVRRYGRLAGVRVPLGVESVAQIRIAGRSEMTMTYQYEMVNGQVVDSEANGDSPMTRRPCEE